MKTSKKDDPQTPTPEDISPEIPQKGVPPSIKPISDEKSTLSGINLDEFKARALDPRKLTKKRILTVPVGKPHPLKQNFFRTHPDLEFPAYILFWDEDGTSYLIHPDVVDLVPNQVKFKMLYPGIYTSGTVFLTAVVQPDSEGKWNNWHESLSLAVNVSRKKWVRLEADMTAQSYNVIEAEADFGEPDWPELTMQQYLDKAFKTTQIKDENHPKIKELYGKE